MDRREFEEVFIAAGIALFAGNTIEAAEEKPGTPKPNVNAQLIAFRERLLGLTMIDKDNTTLHCVDGAETAIVQWRWAHFKDTMDAVHLPMVERVNAELADAIGAAHDFPDAGLDRLHLEGMVMGKEKRMIDLYRSLHRQAIERQLTTVVPFGTSDIHPTPEEIEKELWNPKRLRRPVPQFVVSHEHPKGRTLVVSVLGRLGAAHVLEKQKGITLVATEDPYIDRKADWAEKFGTPDEYKLWIHDKRNKVFVACARESVLAMYHLLLGYAHDLRKEIEWSNANLPKKISHLVVTVRGLTKDAGGV